MAAEGETVGWVAVGGEEGEEVYIAGGIAKALGYIKEVSTDSNYIFKLADWET